MKARKIPSCLIVAMLLSFILSSAGCANQKNLPEGFVPAQLISIKENGHLVLSYQNTTKELKLIGVDLPLLNNDNFAPYGHEVKDYLNEKLAGKHFYLEFQTDNSFFNNQVYLWLNIPKNLTDDEIIKNMLNAQMLVKGYTIYQPVINSKYEKTLNLCNEYARKNNLAFWKMFSM